MGSSQILRTILLLCRKKRFRGTISEDLVICYLTKYLLNDVNEIHVTINKNMSAIYCQNFIGF